MGEINELERRVDELGEKLDYLRQRAYQIAVKHDLYRKVSKILTIAGEERASDKYVFEDGEIKVRAWCSEHSIQINDKVVFASRGPEVTPSVLHPGDWIDDINTLLAQLEVEARINELEHTIKTLESDIEAYEGVENESRG